LEAALVGLTESDLNTAQTTGTWTIRQIVHHIVDGDDIWKTCIKAALGNSEGLFHLQWYWDRPQTEWAENWRYANRSIEPSLALFRANRCHVMALIQQVPAAWEQSIRVKWPDQQEERITVGDVIEMQAGHTMGHIHDIRMIRQVHGI
jgi:uncharacterized damage-inducible protein DinB